MRTKLRICNKHKTYTSVGNVALAATRGDRKKIAVLLKQVPYKEGAANVLVVLQGRPVTGCGGRAKDSKDRVKKCNSFIFY